MLDVKSQIFPSLRAVVVLVPPSDEATAQIPAAKVLWKTGRLRHPPPRRDIAVLLGRQLEQEYGSNDLKTTVSHQQALSTA